MNAPDADPAIRLQPVAPGERIAALDVLRGCALFGVLVAYTVWNLGSPPWDTYSALDRALERVLSAIVDSKAYTLFGFLFGLGFAIQLTRAEGRGASIVPAYCRRLLALLSIGLAHAFLLRNGDILVPYATMGFVLLAFRRASRRTLIIAAIVAVFMPDLVRGVWMLTGAPFPERPQGGGGGYFRENAAWVRYWYSIAITLWPASLPMFFFGLYMGRRRFFDDLPARRGALYRTLVIGLAVGVLAFVLRMLLASRVSGAPTFGIRFGAGLLWTVHAWGLAACYASAVLLLMQRPAWQGLLAPIGAVGRMALTHYLLQAVIVVPVCLIFGLFDRVTPTIGVLLAVAVAAVQILFSVWWLKRYRFGPAEWLWRSLTYGRVQPMRVLTTA